MRLVLDINVVASALLWGGSPRLLLQAARDKRVRLFTSTPLLSELTDILGRRKFEKKIATALLSIDEIVDRYAEMTTLVHPTLISGIAPDPDDDVVIGTALAAQADWVVTGDRPFLSIGAYQNVEVIEVSEAVQRVASLKTLGAD
ncbi:MAG: putative toxin-antitoxin system toxin component, PIN family [Methylophilaceae bacterium]